MEFNRPSAAKNVTPSVEKEENVAGIQVPSGQIPDPTDGKTSRQTEILTSEITINITPSSSAKPNNESTGSSSSGNGTTCHQCRQSNKTALVACKNMWRNKQCCVKICDRCLLNRYDEKAEEVAALAGWSCPKCRGICNCSVCRKRKGKKPTGVFSKKAKATDERQAENSRSEELDANDYSKDDDLVGDSEIDNKKEKEEDKIDIPLPAGIELSSLAGVDVRADDVGHALQFLEFCSVFEEILELKKREAETILREMLHVETASPTLTIQFLIYLLSLLEKSTTPSPLNGENSWFQRLKNYFSEVQSLLKQSDVDSLLRAADYESLNASEKLRIMNLLCDEVLGTEKVRSWIENKNNEFLERIKEAKQKAHAAKGKEKNLKQKMKEDVKKAIDHKDGAPLSSSEHEAAISLTKCEAERAHAEVIELESIFRKTNKTCNALRLEPLFTDHHGNAYWKLNSSDKSYVLQENVGKGHALTLDETWYVLDDAGVQMIEKHISSMKKKFRKRRAPEASSSQPRTG